MTAPLAPPGAGGSDRSGTYHGFPLDPFQREAIDAISRGESAIVSAPTGSGKTLIAEYAVERALEAGERVIYTAPIKALSNQKYRDFTARFPGRAGILTGDVSIRPDAPLVIMTTEIYRNRLLEDPERTFAQTVIFDEIHYLSDEERGTVWEESLVFTPPGAQILCLSATIPNLDQFHGWLRSLRQEPVRAVATEVRPVPLRQFLFLKGLGPVTWEQVGRGIAHVPERTGRNAATVRLLREVANRGHLPCLHFAFSRRRCEDVAETAAHVAPVEPDRARALSRLYRRLVRRYDLGAHSEAARMGRLVERGAAYHHAGLLPSLKEIVERCFTTGALRWLAATETFAMGINMPAATVVFDEVTRYNGVSVEYLSPRDYQQMSGRAGRRGMDTEGHVWVQIDPRDADPSPLRRALQGKPEPIVSRLNLGYATLLELRQRYASAAEEVIERSFAVFCHRAGRPGSRPDPWRTELAARTRVLRELGYLKGDALTGKALFAMHVSGHELLATEALARGHLQVKSPHELNALASTLVTEAKKRPVLRGGPRRRNGHGPSMKIVSLGRHVRRVEEEAKIRSPIPQVTAEHAAVVNAWSRGAAFEGLPQWTTEDPGDVVRLLRMTIQILRLIREGIEAAPGFSPPGRDRLLRLIPEAIHAINRDEVDAERQMRLGIGETLEPEETPGPPDPGSA